MRAAVVAVAVVCIVARAAAHHSWTSDYDGAKPVTVKGVVTKVEWTNPLQYICIENNQYGLPSGRANPYAEK